MLTVQLKCRVMYVSTTYRDHAFVDEVDQHTVIIEKTKMAANCDFSYKFKTTYFAKHLGFSGSFYRSFGFR